MNKIMIFKKRPYYTPKSYVIKFDSENCLLSTSTENATTDMSSTHNVMKDANAEQYSQQKNFNPIWSNMND